MTENKKRVYQAQIIAPPKLKPARKTPKLGTTPDQSAEKPRSGAPEDLPKQELIIRLIDYLKSI